MLHGGYKEGIITFLIRQCWPVEAAGPVMKVRSERAQFDSKQLKGARQKQSYITSFALSRVTFA
jgi:hypothetical protein